MDPKSIPVLSDKLENICSQIAELDKKINDLVNRDDLFYGITGLARILQCSKSTARKYFNQGQIPYKRIGSKLIFIHDEVMASISIKTNNQNES
jgi:hypothetical protein